MAKKNLTVKIFAFLALFGIIIGIIGTGILFIFDNQNNTNQVPSLTIDDLNKIIETQTGVTNTGTTNTGSLK